MDYELISRTALFQGCSPTATENLLYGLKTFTKKYKKGAPVYLAGTPVTDVGIVLYGTVQIENNDLWGNKNIISLARAGEVFAEAYACIPDEPMMVDVIAMEEAEILFLNVPELFRLAAAGKGDTKQKSVYCNQSVVYQFKYIEKRHHCLLLFASAQKRRGVLTV